MRYSSAANQVTPSSGLGHHYTSTFPFNTISVPKTTKFLTHTPIFSNPFTQNSNPYIFSSTNQISKSNQPSWNSVSASPLNTEGTSKIANLPTGVEKTTQNFTPGQKVEVLETSHSGGGSTSSILSSNEQLSTTAKRSNPASTTSKDLTSTSPKNLKQTTLEEKFEDLLVENFDLELDFEAENTPPVAMQTETENVSKAEKPSSTLWPGNSSRKISTTAARRMPSTRSQPAKAQAKAVGKGTHFCQINKICKLKLDVGNIQWQSGQPYQFTLQFKNPVLNSYTFFKQMSPFTDPLYLYYGYLVSEEFNKLILPERYKEYELEIKFNGRHIIDSPFKIRVWSSDV